MMDIVALFERFGPWVAILIIGAVTWSRDAGINDRIVAEFTKTNATGQETLSKIATTMTQQSIITNERNATLEKLLAQAREELHTERMGSLGLRATLTDTALMLGHKERELQDAQEANGALKAARGELDVQFATLKTDVGLLTSRLEIAEAKLSESDEHITRLEGQQQTMKAELEEAKRLREQTEALNQALTEERDRLAADNQAQAALIEQYTTRLATFEEENRLLKERLTELEKRIEGMNHVDESDEMVGDVGGAGDAAGPDGSDGAG